MSLEITNDDLPALYKTADKSSNKAQRSYIRLVRLDLALLVAGALATSWAVSSEDLRVTLALVGAATLLGGFFFTAVVLQRRPDKQWFQARAIAESVKSISWRYMMAAEPYGRAGDGVQGGMSEAEVDKEFLKEMKGILQGTAGGINLSGPDATGEAITARMREVRQLELAGRKDIYLRGRIQDQQQWYASKGDTNARFSTKWLYTVSGTQLAAVMAAVALVRWPDFQFNVAAVLAALAASFMAWLQVRQHQELAHAYSQAAFELGFIRSELDHIETATEFSIFVADAENAISREHTMWRARRDVLS